MAITTDSYITVSSGGITYDTIGLSKTLDNYTMSELQDYIYCAGDNTLFKHITEKMNDTLVNALADVDVPVTVEQYSSTIMVANAGNPDNENQGSKGVYAKVVWLKRISNTNRLVITSDDIGDYKLVTKFKAKNYVLDLGSPSKVNSDTSTSYGTTNWAGSDQTAHPVWYNSYCYLCYYSDNQGTVVINLSSENILPYIIFSYNDKIYLLALSLVNNEFYSNNNNGYSNPITASSYSSFDKSSAISISTAIEQTWNAQWDNTDWNFPEDWTKTGGGMYGWSYTADCFNDDLCMIGLVNGSRLNSGCRLKFYFTSRPAVLDFWKCCGIKFYGDKIYKPIIVDGYVTGYTDNLDAESELDEWIGDTKHTVPSSRPGGGGGGGSYDDDPWSGVSFSGVGLGGGGAFARCYYMTSTELANLRTWMSGVGVPEGFNPMAQIIGLSQVPVALSGDAPETVQFINSSAVYDPGITSRIVDSNVSTQYSMGGPIKYSLGSVDIVRRMQERGEPYLDYSCQIELYLPLIGMFSLDTQAVMGRTIEAEAILDPISGTLAAYAWVSKDGHKLPVAYGSTTISVDLPVTAQQYSVSKAALKQANAQLGTSILSSVATLVAAAVGGGKAEGSNARVSGGASSMQGARGMNSYAQASSIAASQAAISQTGNIVGDFMQWGRTIKQLQYGNNTAISGSFGGSVAQWSYPFQAYVKINRPRYEKPENYAHTQGVPCVQKKRIGDCTGFIQCIGVDVDNHIEGATDLERQAIQAALSSGIYAGGGGE